MIHFICALKCEAAPIITYYSLKYLPDSSLFSIYISDDKNISLTVTGVGKLCANAAVIYSYTTLACGDGDVWLNVGIAGHRDHAIGDIYLSHRIEDSSSAEVWYPQLLIDIEMHTEKLLTLDQPSTNYNDAMLDMEASGFISAACRFASMEFIHSVKIISDNQLKPVERLSNDTVSTLIELKREKIIELTSKLEALSCELKSGIEISSDFALFLEQWHFTQYQQTQLKQLLHRWHLLSPDLSPLTSISQPCNDAGTALALLVKKMNDSEFYLHRNRPGV